MKDFCQYILITVVAVCLLRLIKIYRQDISIPSSVGVVVGLIGASLSVVLPVIDYANDLAERFDFPYLSILWKSIGVSILTVTCADICRASDEAAIAEKVELLGKCELLLIALPLVKELTTLVITIAQETL